MKKLLLLLATALGLSANAAEPIPGEYYRLVLGYTGDSNRINKCIGHRTVDGTPNMFGVADIDADAPEQMWKFVPKQVEGTTLYAIVNKAGEYIPPLATSFWSGVSSGNYGQFTKLAPQSLSEGQEIPDEAYTFSFSYTGEISATNLSLYNTDLTDIREGDFYCHIKPQSVKKNDGVVITNDGTSGDVLYLNPAGNPKGYSLHLYKSESSSGPNGSSQFFILVPIERPEEVTVTYKFTDMDGNNFTRTCSAMTKQSAADFIPTVNFFTPTGISESNSIISSTNKTFTVRGTWNLPMEFGKIYRVKINPSNNTSKNLRYEEDYVKAVYTDTDESTLAPAYLWYFTYIRSENGAPIVKMHTVADVPENGMTFTINTDNTKAQSTSNPSELVLGKSTIPGLEDNDFLAKVFYGASTGSYNFLNFRSPYFSTWYTTDAYAQRDGGCVLRLQAFNDSELNGGKWNYNGIEINFPEGTVASYLETPSLENFRKLFIGLSDARHNLGTAIAQVEHHTIGTDFGEINNANGNLQNLLNAAKTVFSNPDATDEAMNNAAATIAHNTWDLNFPHEGQYFRIKNGNTYVGAYGRPNDGYLRGVASSDGNEEDFSGNFGYTVYSIKDNKLVAVNSGKVMCGNTANNFNPVLGYADSENALNVTITSNEARSAYVIGLGGNKYLEVTKPTAANATMHDCYFEKVDWLPIPATSGTATTTLYATEELQCFNRVTAYILKWDGQYVTKTPVTDNIIPSGSVVLVEGTGTNYDKCCIWLPVNHTSTVALDAENMLSAQTLAAPQEGAYMFSNGKFVPVAQGAYVPGFQAYFEPDETVTEIPVTWPKHNDHVKSTFVDGTFKITHDGGELTRHEHNTEMIKVRVKQPSQIQAMRRSAGESEVDDEENAIEHDAIIYEDGAASFTLPSLGDGNYTISIPAGYFVINSKNVSKAMDVDFTMKSGTPTGINEVFVGMSNTAIYDLQGRRLAAPVKGINIIGGRKVLVK